LQQSPDCVHCCPYCAQPVAPGGGGGGGFVVPPLVPPLVVPASFPVTIPLWPQVPLVEPSARMHGEPGQQSAVVVHAPPAETHAAAHTKPVPAGFGTHGLSQQSALVAHTVPAGGGLVVQFTSLTAVHRGMPSESCLQFSGCCCTVPAQQRSVASHEFVERRQMEPAALHALP
jgi:hypothetical protein